MSIDAIAKIVDIALKGVVATVLSAGTIYLTLNRDNLARVNTCTTMIDAISKNIGRNPNASEPIIRQAAVQYSEVCGGEVEDIIKLTSSAVSTAGRLEEPTRQAPGQPATSLALPGVPGGFVIQSVPPAGGGTPTPVTSISSGWVALGKVSPSRFSDTNFNQGDGRPVGVGGSTAQGSIVQSRWSVNLRSQPGVSGSPLTTLPAGACVRIKSTPLRTIDTMVWAEVEAASCATS